MYQFLKVSTLTGYNIWKAFLSMKFSIQIINSLSIYQTIWKERRTFDFDFKTVQNYIFYFSKFTLTQFSVLDTSTRSKWQSNPWFIEGIESRDCKSPLCPASNFSKSPQIWHQHLLVLSNRMAVLRYIWKLVQEILQVVNSVKLA